MTFDMSKHHCISRYIVIRALVMGDGVLCYGALETVGLLLLLLLMSFELPVLVALWSNTPTNAHGA